MSIPRSEHRMESDSYRVVGQVPRCAGHLERNHNDIGCTISYHRQAYFNISSNIIIKMSEKCYCQLPRLWSVDYQRMNGYGALEE